LVAVSKIDFFGAESEEKEAQRESPECAPGLSVPSSATRKVHHLMAMTKKIITPITTTTNPKITA